MRSLRPDNTFQDRWRADYIEWQGSVNENLSVPGDEGIGSGRIRKTGLKTHRPTFCFVYIGDLDGLGHRHGWMSKEYLAGLERVDRAVQTLLDSLKQANIREQTLVILTSDHGGEGKSHGEGTPSAAKSHSFSAAPAFTRR